MKNAFHEICQASLPIKPWLARKTNRLPGINPLDPKDWLIRDDAFARQMAYRDHLLATNQSAVFACNINAEPAAVELLERVVTHLAGAAGYLVTETAITRPDGVVVDLRDGHPLIVIGRLCQEDHCILLPQDGGYHLRGAVLCFPASWSLAQKMDQDMTGIHQPVASYDGDIGKRVARMFDRIGPDQPLWRANNLIYTNPDLFQPSRADLDRVDGKGGKWVRVERQTLVRLPESGALCFGIHTYVVPFTSLTAGEAKTLQDHIGSSSP